MGLANNKILKGAVDALTLMLETINKVIDGLSGGSGLIKSIMSLITVIGGLKLGKSLLTGIFDKTVGHVGSVLGLNQKTGGEGAA
jgi:hypothetical protein